MQLKKKGLIRIWNAFGYSLEGLHAAFIHEDAFRQEIFLSIILIPAAFFAPTTALGKAMLISSVLIVLISELINSAIEAAVDRTSLEIHPLAKRAKDIGSSIVFISLINLVVVWVLILYA